MKQHNFLQILEKACAENGYRVAHSTSLAPQAVLVGDFVYRGIRWHVDAIEDILCQCLSMGDTVLHEDSEGEVIYGLMNMRDIAIYHLQSMLEDNAIHTYFNDDYTLLQKQKEIMERWDKNRKKKNREGMDEAIAHHTELDEKREKNFVHGHWGIGKHASRTFQIVRDSHLTKGILRQELDKTGISYAILLPKEEEDSWIVTFYNKMMHILCAGDEPDRLEILDLLKYFPMRRSILELQKVLAHGPDMEKEAATATLTIIKADYAARNKPWRYTFDAND